MGSNGANPGLMKDPWKPDDVCLAAVFGQDSLLLGSGDLAANGYLAIAPRKKEKLPKEHYPKHNQDQQFTAARINGPVILLIFPKPEDARDVALMLMTLAEDMETRAKSSQNITREPNDGTK